MSKFSISQLFKTQLDNIEVVFKRFYLVAISAIGLTLLLLYYIENETALSDSAELLITKFMLAFGLAIPLFFSLHLFAEKNALKPLKFILGILTVLIVITSYWLSLNTENKYYWNNETNAIRFFALFIAAHGTISISVYNKYREINGFWQFNKHLLLRMLTGTFYSGVLFLGIAMAFLSMDALFSVNIDSKTYLQVFIVLACAYNTFYVLGGVKHPFSIYLETSEYPNSLKIFTQFVLIPLMVLYMAILYAYLGKIIALWSLPKGWVSNLVLGFSIAGILAFLLVYPIREELNSKWVKTYSRLFYFAICPLILLLHFSIWTRVMDYGITIERYIVCGLSIWLTVITLYFLLSRKDNIIWIPLTLSVMFYLSTFGPWGFEGLSKYSQLSRLKQEFKALKIWDGNKIIPLKQNAVFNDSLAYAARDISSYLIEMNGFRAMKYFGYEPWNKLTDSLNNIKDHSYYGSADLYFYKVNLDPSKIKWSPYSSEYSNTNTSFYLALSDANKAYPVGGYQSMYPLNVYENSIPLEIDSLSLQMKTNIITISNSENIVDSIKLSGYINPYLIDCKSGCPPLQKPIIVDYANKQRKIRLLINNLSGTNNNDSLVISSINGYLLVK